MLSSVLASHDNAWATNPVRRRESDGTRDGGDHPRRSSTVGSSFAPPASSARCPPTAAVRDPSSAWPKDPPLRGQRRFYVHTANPPGGKRVSGTPIPWSWGRDPRNPPPTHTQEPTTFPLGRRRAAPNPTKLSHEPGTAPGESADRQGPASFSNPRQPSAAFCVSPRPPKPFVSIRETSWGSGGAPWRRDAQNNQTSWYFSDLSLPPSLCCHDGLGLYIPHRILGGSSTGKRLALASLISRKFGSSSRDTQWQAYIVFALRCGVASHPRTEQLGVVPGRGRRKRGCEDVTPTSLSGELQAPPAPYLSGEVVTILGSYLNYGR